MSGFCRSSVVALLAKTLLWRESFSSGSAAKILQTNQEKSVSMLISKLQMSERPDWSLWLRFVVFKIDLKISQNVLNVTAAF